METYDQIVDLIINEMKAKKIAYCTMANMIGVYRTSMKSYYYKERLMPAQVMFKCLNELGIKIEIRREDSDI